MTYSESKGELGLVTIEVVCDARKGKGICGNSASITMADRKTIQRFLYALGWRLLRGRQVCSLCMKKYPKISFPREEKAHAGTSV